MSVVVVTTLLRISGWCVWKFHVTWQSMFVCLFFILFYLVETEERSLQTKKRTWKFDILLMSCVKYVLRSVEYD